MGRSLRHIILFLALLAMQVVSAQGSADAHSRAGDRFYQKMAYRDAADEYKLAADLGAVNEHVTKRLADCYMKLGDSENAERWYAQVVKFLNREPMDLFYYAQALKGNAKYTEAGEWMDRYLEMARPEGQPLTSNIPEFAKKFTYGMDRFTVRSVSCNSEYSDMSPAWNGDQVIFSSSRNTTVGIQRVAAWNDQPFLDLYTARREPTGDLVDPRRVEGGVNSALHEGPVVCDASGQFMWYTRNSGTKSKNGVQRLNILKAHRSGNGWSGAEPFPYNSTETSVGDPALSADGHTMVFASDMPGGFGGSDLYICKDVGGQWGEPQNLGPVINTSQSEGFPFIAADGTLWFASNGLPSLGGLDIYAAQKGEDGKYSIAINVGVPVNGPKDDFGLIIDAANKHGYFTSNRPGGRGDDDIYMFEMNAPIEQRFVCTGTVIDDESGTPMTEVDVFMYDSLGNVVEQKQTDVNGKYSFAVQKDKQYRLVARSKGRYDGESHLSTESIEQQQILARDIHMVPDAGIYLRGSAHLKDKLGYIEGALVTLVNTQTFYQEQKTTGVDGGFSFRLQQNEEFEVLVEKPGFYSISVPVTTVGVKQGVIDLNQAHDLAFEPIEIGKAVELKFVKWTGTSVTLEPLAKTELDELADRLQVNPSLQIEIGVHCDARGDLNNDLKLTQKRADAVLAYLKMKGLQASRVVAKGYGATHLVNHCAPGVTCTEEEHEANRRTVYTVTATGDR